MRLDSLGKLGRRLLSSIIVSALLIVILVIASVVSIRIFLNENIQGQKALDRIDTSINLIDKSLVDQETGQRGFNLTKDESFLEPYYIGIEVFLENSKLLLEDTEYHEDINKEAKVVIQKGEYWQETFARPQVESSLNGKQPSIQSLQQGKLAFDDFRQTINGFSEHVEVQRSIVRETMQVRINTTLIILVLIIIGIILTNLFFNYKVLKSVIKPIIDLSECVNSYAQHDFARQIPNYEQKDELFDLIENVDSMRYELAASIKSLESKVYFDGLTGLYNRRFFNEYILKEWERAKQKSEKLSLILFDVDHYKFFNDTYGHLAGDECLRAISKRLQEYNKNPMNLVARYGGEEFAVLLKERKEEEALTLAEEIRQTILDLRIEHKSSPTHRYVSISLGVVTAIPKEDLNPNQLISAADEALYKSKHNGRNQVTLMQMPEVVPVL